jgi:DNA invertase Pin-like site-specific DNA recombinase
MRQRPPMIYGYARVGTTGQDLAIQGAALRAAGCDEIRSEKVSGTSREGRIELDALLSFMRKGDTLVITRIDRLARSIGDLQDIVRALKAKGVMLKATEQPIDTSTAAGKAFLDMLGVFAEFETNLRKERQMEGIAKASIRAASRRSTAPGCANCKQRASAPPRSPSSSRSVGRASTGGREKRCRSLSFHRAGVKTVPSPSHRGRVV